MECEQTLAYLDQPLEIWIAQLQDDDPLIRRLAVYALSMIGPGCCSAALPALVPLLEDPEGFVRIWAAAALVRIARGSAGSMRTSAAAAQMRTNPSESSNSGTSAGSAAEQHPGPIMLSA